MLACYVILPYLIGFHDVNVLLFFTHTVRLYRRKLVTADGGFLNSNSVPLSEIAQAAEHA